VDDDSFTENEREEYMASLVIKDQKAAIAAHLKSKELQLM